MTWQEDLNSDAWQPAVTARRRDIGARAEMVDYDGNHVCDLPLSRVTVDFNSEQSEQWAASLTITDPAFVPLNATNPTDPRSGLRCRIYWQLKVEGNWVDIPVGTYHLEDPDTSDDGRLSCTLSGRDPLAEAKRGGYRGRTIDLGGLTVTEALRRIFEVVAPRLPLNIESSTVTLPAVYSVGNRPPAEDWTTIAEMAGFIVRTNREGTIVCAPRAETSNIRAYFKEGVDNPMITISRGVKTSTMINRVVAVSTSTEITTPIVGVVEDTDEGSSTWVGRYGPYETRIESDTISSVTAAENMARATYERWRHPMESVEITVPQRPDLEGRDLCSIARARVGAVGLYRVSGWKLTLTSGDQAPPTMTLTMMSRSIQ